MDPEATPTPTPTEKKAKRNKLSNRSAEDALQWAVGSGIGEHLALADPSGQVQLGKLRCNLCGTWISFKGDVLKDHVLGRKQERCLLVVGMPCVCLNPVALIVFMWYLLENGADPPPPRFHSGGGFPPF